MPHLHDLAGEVSLCLRHCAVAFSGSRPEVMIVSGRDAWEPGLAHMLESRIGFPVLLDDEQENVSCLAEGLSKACIRGDDPSAWTAAMGLAMRPASNRAESQRRERAA